MAKLQPHKILRTLLTKMTFELMDVISWFTNSALITNKGFHLSMFGVLMRLSWSLFPAWQKPRDDAKILAVQPILAPCTLMTEWKIVLVGSWLLSCACAYSTQLCIGNSLVRLQSYGLTIVWASMPLIYPLASMNIAIEERLVDIQCVPLCVAKFWPRHDLDSCTPVFPKPAGHWTGLSRRIVWRWSMTHELSMWAAFPPSPPRAATLSVP